MGKLHRCSYSTSVLDLKITYKKSFPVLNARALASLHIGVNVQ